MKNPFLSSFCLFIFCLGVGILSSRAQEMHTIAPHKKYAVKKRTILEEYEPFMVLSAEERLVMKKEREAILTYRREIIDSLQISDKKRKKLLRELYLSPSSAQWDKLSTRILDEEEINEDP